jgi:signal transduction histidine kinase/HAMP domain-containing protein
MRLSIARSLGIALIALTIALALVAATGVMSLYRARQHYETTLAQTSSASTAIANLTSEGISEAEVLRDARGPGAAAERQAAERQYARAAAVATNLTRSDPVSANFVARQIAAQARARHLASTGRLSTAQSRGGPLQRATTLANDAQRRQRTLEAQANSRAQTQSHHAIALVVGTGIAALAGALALIAALVHSMRRPLDELVDATRDLAAGELERRVRPEGPRELRDLGEAFNAMGDDLASAQARIEEERHRLAVTIESLGDALFVTEPGSTTVATTNPRAVELLPELRPGDRVDGDSSPLPSLAIALKKETVIEHDGRILAVTAAPLGEEADGVVWTVRDVTERARLERAKSEFVATASHELRSPLTSIKGFVELLERSPENMSERQREFIDIVLRSTDRLVDLVNDLLDVARIEADNVEINRRPIDIGEAVRDVAELMGPRISDKHQALGVHVAPALPLAYADPGRIRQIIANLLTNAHIYTDEGGRIEVTAEADRAWVKITVADSGVGMTADERSHIFDRFYRAHGASAVAPGTGLGLSIVESLVNLHDGKIEVKSEPGEGTTFYVSIPAAVTAQASESLDLIRGRKVLIVDNERANAELIRGQLAPLEISPTVATSRAEAMELLRSERFDAITLDVLMPDRIGFELLREIRADPELRATPIVCVSLFARKELAGEWVVSKPIDANELRDVLASAVSAGRSRVLVVGRTNMQLTLEPALDELGIEHQWETTGAAAARVCHERRFEVALIDVGIRNPQAALQALDLRGRRLRRAVILFSDGATPTPSGIVKLGMEVVPVEDAAQALVETLRGDTHEAGQEEGWRSQASLS